MPTDEDGELLVMLLDTNVLLGVHGTDGAAPPQDVALQLLLFLRTHLLLNEHNHLCIMAVHHHSSPVIFSTAHTGSLERQHLASTFLERMQLLLKREEAIQPGSAGPGPGSEDAVLSGSLSRALCYINRHIGEQKSGSRRARPRLLVVSASSDASMQYIAVMNAIFSAQHAGVVIDALVLGGTDSADSAYLQQAAHITGGMYLKPKHISGLLQYLLCMFCADTHTRGMLNMYKPTGVDYRAACFCHKQTIDIGFVCSVCLSIFCSKGRAMTMCPTCGTSFKAVARVSESGAAPHGNR